jgi:peptidyl-prolyl cis-trans isomerase C
MLRLTLLLVCVALLAGRVAAAEPEVIATVGDRQVTAEEFGREIARQRKGGDLQQMLKAFDSGRRRELLDEYIDQKLLVLGALKTGLDRDPDVAAEIREATDGILSAAFLKQTLDRQVTATALKEFYEQNRSFFQLPPRVKARHILLKSAREAEEMLVRLKNGEDFCQLAALKSTDTTTSGSCGDLGWMDKGIMVKAFEDSLFALNPGEVSGVVQTSYGFHLIRVMERQEGRVPPFEAVHTQVDRQLRSRLLEKIRQGLKREFPVQVTNKAL